MRVSLDDMKGLNKFDNNLDSYSKGLLDEKHQPIAIQTTAPS